MRNNQKLFPTAIASNTACGKTGYNYNLQNCHSLTLLFKRGVKTIQRFIKT